MSLRLVPGLEEKVLSISQPVYGRILHQQARPNKVEVYDGGAKSKVLLYLLYGLVFVLCEKK